MINDDWPDDPSLLLPDGYDAQDATNFNASSSEGMPSMDELIRIMDSFPKPEHDRIVTTDAVMQRLRAEFDLCPKSHMSLMSIELACLKIETHSSSVAAVCRALELMEEGKRPMLVIEEALGTQEAISESPRPS